MRTRPASASSAISICSARQAADAVERHVAGEHLRAQMGDLTRFNAAAVGRETRMIELKKEVNALAARLGEAPRYSLDFEKDADGG